MPTSNQSKLDDKTFKSKIAALSSRWKNDLYETYRTNATTNSCIGKSVIKSQRSIEAW